MKHITRLGALILTLVLALVSTSFGQTATTSTYLTNAITSMSPAPINIVLNSATGVAAGTELFVDKEAFYVSPSYVSGTTIPVLRGQDSTAITTHLANSVVWVGTNSTSSQVFVYTTPSGSCTRANMLNTPQINVTTGDVIDCVNGNWAAYRAIPQGMHAYSYQQISQANGLIANTSAGYTVRSSDYIIALGTTGTGSGGTSKVVNTITLPAANNYQGRVLMIKDESGGLSATTMVQFVGTIDGNQTSFQMLTSWGGLTLYAGSNSWFTVGCWSTGCR